MVEVEKDYASKGVAGAGLGLGIAGTALGLMQNGNLGGIFGGGNGGGAYVTRYDAEKDARIAQLEIWADLTHDWLEDQDAQAHKAGRYWRDIVKHE